MTENTIYGFMVSESRLNPQGQLERIPLHHYLRRLSIGGVDASFWMNYQQLKLDICDVFVFVGVWVDRIVYWVMSNDDVRSSPYLSPQHRGGIEYQIGIRDSNIDEFESYRVEAPDIASAVIAKGRY